MGEQGGYGLGPAETAATSERVAPTRRSPPAVQPPFRPPHVVNTLLLKLILRFIGGPPVIVGISVAERCPGGFKR